MPLGFNFVDQEIKKQHKFATDCSQSNREIDRGPNKKKISFYWSM